jgi:DNA-directed RNA polymerase subunit RPC12/RpoP
MALIKCRECGKDVSTEAVACPNCGAKPEPPPKPPVPSVRRGFIVGLVIVLVVGLAGWTYGRRIYWQYRHNKLIRETDELLARVDADLAAGKKARELQEKGEIKVERVWEDAKIDYGYALVSYENSSANSFAGGVTIQCDAMGKEEQKIGTNFRGFFSHEYGPIVPGFKGTLEIPVELNGADFESMRCWISKAY